MPTFTATVPASSANLGPGYDSFGLALALRNRVSAEPAEDWAIQVVGEGAGELRTDARNPVARAMRRVFEESGEGHRSARVMCVNKIPPGRGLGSSAAAIVGGMLVADAMCEVPLGKHRIFEMAAEFEGHPDNVAAAVFGGLTLAWSEGGEARCVSVPPRGGLAAIAVVSSLPMQTKRARKMLPEFVPHADAAFSAGRAGILVAGLALGRGDLLEPGLQDRIHEQYRAAAIEDFAEVRAALLAAGARGAVLSGAGPTVVGLVDGADDEEAFRHASDVAERAGAAIERLARRRPPMPLAIDREGASVERA